VAVLTLLIKDLREHAFALLLLGGGFVLMLLLALAQNRAGTFSMSALEIIPFALTLLLPLVAFITGNRLIVREYLGRTRLFVEALPVGTVTPLVLKFVAGFVYLAVLGIIMVLMASRAAGTADQIDVAFLMLLMVKTLSMVVLVWSVVFCFSLCGHLRAALYLALLGIIILLMVMPGFDENRLGPFALMDSQLFAFERDVIPWQDLVETLALAAVFTGVGFILALVGDGSLAEQLAKPMSRRDYVALSIMVVAGLTLFATLAEDSERETWSFSGDAVVRQLDPPVSIFYARSEYKQRSEQVLVDLVGALILAQAEFGLEHLPRVRVSLEPERGKHDIELQSLDGVLITVNYLDYDSYDDATLRAVVLHQVFQQLTSGRMSFEPWHWLLDGFTRWWVEAAKPEMHASHDAELFARALLAVNRMPEEIDLMRRWQVLADQVGYPSAEALAYTAMVYLQERVGNDAVLRLANGALTEPVGNSSLVSLRQLFQPATAHFRSTTDLHWQAFQKDWRRWLITQAAREDVAGLIAAAPAISGYVNATTDADGVHQLQAGYVELPAYTGQFDGLCVMRHQRVSAFDAEVVIPDDQRVTADCTVGEVAHRISSRYAAGDRLYVVLEYESGSFHQPLRLWAGRFNSE
jgi:hypothetical protein